MGWLFGKEVDDKVSRLDRALKESFANVKQDTNALYQWVAYFQQQFARQNQLVEEQQHDLDDYEQEILRQRQLIERMQAELRAVPKDSETIKRIVDAYYDFDAILERVRQIEDKLRHLEHQKAAPAVQQIRHEVAALPHVAPPSRTQALRDKIVQRITRNSKEYLKGLIMSMITKYGKISALQLREMLVEEQGLASKSSFYRLLEELEAENAIGVIHEGKEKLLMVGGHLKKAVGR
jgi:DNA repair ATPase RecN